MKSLIITIVLLITLYFGIGLIANKFGNNDTFLLFILCFFISIASFLALLHHTIYYLSRSYEYRSFIVKRNAFELTIGISRDATSSAERTSILEQISKWNQALAMHQLNRSHWLYTEYTDERFDVLEPIR